MSGPDAEGKDADEIDGAVGSEAVTVSGDRVDASDGDKDVAAASGVDSVVISKAEGGNNVTVTAINNCVAAVGANSDAGVTLD